MQKQALENHERYLARIELYKRFGYDIPEERKKIIEKSRPLDGRILEIGTGKGYFSIELARQGYHFTSVDILESEQEIARLNIEYFGLQEFINFQIEKENFLSFSNQSFDILFCINTIHHFLYPYKMLDEMIRIKSSQGKLILCDFTQEGFAVIEKILSSEGRKHEATPTMLEDIEEYLGQKNFKMISHKSTFQKILIVS